MIDNLPEAYQAYQTALYHLHDLTQPRLWYGIGILYDRYGSLEHAEEAFSQVMRMAPDFEKANEIYFRLGIIYKQQQKFQQSLDVSEIEKVDESHLTRLVLPLHCIESSQAADRGRYPFPTWSRL